MKSVFARSAMGSPALRAALVSMVMIASALCCRIAVLNAFTAPAGPLSSSSGISLTGRPMMPPLAFSSSTASSADCTTAGATTLFTPERPTGTAMTMRCACGSADGSGGAVPPPLLHQHLGEPRDDAGLKPFGDLVHENQARASKEGPSDEEHLLLPPRERPRALLPPRLQHREPARDRLEPRVEADAVSQREAEVLFHRQVLEDRLLLGNIAHPEARDPVGRPSGDVLSEKLHAALLGWQEPHDRLEERRLPHPVLPENGEDLSARDVEGDGPENRRLAVAPLEGLDGDHVLPPM